KPPAALVEVQAYVYAAKAGIADLYAVDGDVVRADRLRGEARELHERFERDFWMEAESCYAQALDGNKRQVPAVTSNAGHALWCGIAAPGRPALPEQPAPRALVRLPARPALLVATG